MKSGYQIIPAQPGFFVILDVYESEGALVPFRMPIVAWRVETDLDGDLLTSTNIPVTMFHDQYDWGIIQDPSGSVYCYEFGIEFDLETIMQAMWDAKSEDQRECSTIKWDTLINTFTEGQRRR